MHPFARYVSPYNYGNPTPKMYLLVETKKHLRNHDLDYCCCRELKVEPISLPLRHEFKGLGSFLTKCCQRFFPSDHSFFDNNHPETGKYHIRLQFSLLIFIYVLKNCERKNLVLPAVCKKNIEKLRGQKKILPTVWPKTGKPAKCWNILRAKKDFATSAA